MPVTPFNISFLNEHTIHEKIVKCTIKNTDYNCSYNPTLQVDGSLIPFATSGSFSPYMSGIGLYDNANNLLAVAKFGQPVPLSGKTDFNVLVKFDL
jgi:hypothetical protein